MRTFPASQFAVPTVRRAGFGGFDLAETRYDGLAVLPRHAHENACFVVALGGTSLDRSALRPEATIRPGMVIFRPRHEPHDNDDSAWIADAGVHPVHLAASFQRWHPLTVGRWPLAGATANGQRLTAN